jgi:hypothetical protein
MHLTKREGFPTVQKNPQIYSFLESVALEFRWEFEMELPF